MKLPVLVLTGILALNATLLAVYLNRRSAPHSPAPALEASSGTASRSAALPTNPKPNPQNSKTASDLSPVSAADVSPAAWSTLDSSDLRTLVLRLRAAGFPPSVIATIVRTQIAEKMRPRHQALIAGVEESPFWATDGNRMGLIGATDPKTLAAQRELSRESNELFKAAIGSETLTADLAANEFTRRRYGNITGEKIELLQRIDADYNELRNEVNNAARGLMLPEDREKLALLETERRADLAKLLSPQELEDFLVRTSTTTTRLRTALTNMNASEEEFRAIYKVQSAYEEKFLPRNAATFTTATGPELAAERREALVQVGEELKLALGAERYAEYSRASDREFQAISRVTQQANLPATAAVQVYDLRDNVSKESNRIFADTTLTNDKKRAALQTLAQTTRGQITATLGNSAASGYLQSANWLNSVERGAAVTFTPTGGTSIRNVPAARPPGAPGARPAPGTPAPATAVPVR